MIKRAASAILALGLMHFLVPGAAARELNFEERVEAQAAIERVYYAHQIGATKPFEDAVPKAVLEEKIRSYLGQSVALAVFWRTPLTAEMLERETDRIVRGTAMPERLQELFAALGNDEFLVQECLARPILVDRLTRNFFAYDERIHAAAHQEADKLRAGLVGSAIDPRDEHAQRSVVETVVRQEPAPSADEPTLTDGLRQRAGVSRRQLDAEEFTKLRATLLRVGEVGALREDRDVFSVSIVLEEEERRLEVASYTVSKASWDAWWAESRKRFEGHRVRAVAAPGVRLGPLLRSAPGAAAGASTCVPDDTWDNGVLDDIPSQRSYHTAVWTGSEMIIWGGLGVESTADGYQVSLDKGGRYDPATDTWRPTSTLGAPPPRYAHTAVWTGSEMVVWGGFGLRNDGGRYDPVADTWLPMSTLNAPSGRQFHDAVWTGSEMLVWGAVPGGGRYDPQADTWRAMSTTDAPTTLGGHSVVWTGREMVVWGGMESVTTVNTGGRYDPVADRWTAISTVDAPTGRAYHSAVWSGSEMVVWGGAGGEYGSLVPFRSGGRYDPATDRWTPTSTLNAPMARGEHSAVWTGNQMVVWGGEGSYLFNTGGRYDPVTDNWRPTSTVNAPLTRTYESAVWTGELMIIWGGNMHVEGGVTNSGGRYDPVSDSWTPVSTTPSLRTVHTAVWTGSEMIMWGGGDDARYFNTGGRYDPATDHWTPTGVMGAPTPRGNHSAVWTGGEMVVWGGSSASGLLNTGGRYDPRTDRWSPTATAGAPSPRRDAPIVWTGQEVVLWGGWDAEWPPPSDAGGRYDPAADTWRPISTIGAPSSRAGHSVVWTGREMLVWGGRAPSYASLRTGGRYDSQTDTWASISTVNAPDGRYNHAAVWTSQEMVVWGGSAGNAVNTGGRYDPKGDAWRSTTTLGAPSARSPGEAIWTGREMVAWGGFIPVVGYVDTGGRYDPRADRWAPMSMRNAPSARYNHSVIWTGRSMIIWGGELANQAYLNSGGRYFPDDSTDNDGDGVRECDGDCNDGDASIFPGAREVCDGVDQDCNGVVEDGDADGDGHPVCEDCDDADADVHETPAEVMDLEFNGWRFLTWAQAAPSDGGEIVYDVVRGSLSALPVGSDSEICLAQGMLRCTTVDAENPPAGAGYWYLVRARRNRCAGSWGTGSGGEDRTPTGCGP